ATVRHVVARRALQRALSDIHLVTHR
ncbi:MAG: hypothetical protein QOG20_825, partial [Pseudonocardiales bacterium]|nr:hypothetical protein [Pseudonocardiales bacterium]